MTTKPLPRMSYVRLGQSGLKVSRIILGCMSYGSPKWMDWVLGEEEGIEHIKFAYDHGINTFDTANIRHTIYSNGLSEVILGKAIKKHNIPRDEIVVMTKVWGRVSKAVEDRAVYPHKLDNEGHVNQWGLSRKHIFDSVRHSLERLQLDYIDLFQCHRFDPNTPISETMQALHDIVQAGHVRYIGMSSCWAYEFHQMQNYAISHNLTPFISMQNHYSLLYREEEREMFPTLKAFGVGSIPWSPLGRGLLTRPWNEETSRTKSDPFGAIYRQRESMKTIVDRVEEVAQKKGVKMAQVALAWVMSREGVTAPIIGTTSLDNLKDLLGALDVSLTEEEIQLLNEPYISQPVLGHA